MTPLRLSPDAGGFPKPLGLADSRRDAGRRRIAVGASVLAHALTVAALVLIVRRPPPEGAGSTPSYELMFEGGNQVPPASDRRNDADNVPPPQGAPSPDDTTNTQPPAPPMPEAPERTAPPPAPPDPAFAEPTAPAPAPTPAPAEAAAPEPATPPPPVEAAPAAPAPAAPAAQAPPAPAFEPPAIVVVPEPAPATRPNWADTRLADPEEAPPRPLEPIVPVPPPPLPAPPLPRPPIPRPRPPAPQTGSLSNPMDLDFGRTAQRLAAPRAGAAPGSVASRSLDLSLGTARIGPNRQEAFFDARAANVSADWAQGLRTWWLRHRFYPPEAARAGEDGSVDLELTVNRQGRVELVQIKSHSGSSFIDMAAVGTWRNAQLAPLPAEVQGERITIPITVNYILYR